MSLPPERKRTREIASRIVSVTFTVIFCGTLLTVWAAAMYRFLEWAF